MDRGLRTPAFRSAPPPMPAPAAANRAGANVGPKYHTKSAGAAPRTPLLMYAYSPKFEQAPCGTFPSLPGSTPRLDFEKTVLFGVCLPSLDSLRGPHLKYKGEHRNPGRMGWIGVSAKGCVWFFLSEKTQTSPSWVNLVTICPSGIPPHPGEGGDMQNGKSQNFAH